MPKTSARAAKPRSPASGETGTYKFDRKSGRLVKVSSGVPGLKKKGSAPSRSAGPCGRSACGGGRCAS